MKRSLMIFSSLCLSALVQANTATNAEYKAAMKQYNAKDFKGSYEKLSRLYISNLSDAKLNFYLGRSAYESGHYEMALGAFERVQMLEPTNLRNRLEMGRTYFMLKMYEDAELAFEEVLANPNLPQNVRTNIEIYLSKVTKVQEKSFTYADINADYMYDSNVNYGSLDSEYNINTGTLPSAPTLADSAVEIYGGVTNIYDIGDKNGFAIKNRVVGYMKRYSNERAYDIHYFSYTPSLIYATTAHKIELGLTLDELLIDSESYLHSLSLTPRYEYAHSTTLRSIAYFKYQRKEFLQDIAKDLDANHYELSYGAQKILSPRSYIQGTLTAINEAKLQGDRVDVDYMEYRASVAYANQLTPIYATDLYGEYRKRDYSDYSPFFASTRGDNAGTLMANINAKILPTLLLHLKGMYTRVESNQKLFSYEKYTVTFGLNKTF